MFLLGAFLTVDVNSVFKNQLMCRHRKYLRSLLPLRYSLQGRARVVEKALTGKWHTLPAELELIGQEIASLSSGWSRKVSLNMLSCEEARRQDPRMDSWMLLAENAGLSAHGFICEDGPELPKEEGQEAAQEGGETLEGMYAPGRESLDTTSPGATRTGDDEETIQWIRFFRKAGGRVQHRDQGERTSRGYSIPRKI
jgi:hypothetical protein